MEDTDPEEIELSKKAAKISENQRAYYLENFKNRFYRMTFVEGGQQELDDILRDSLVEVFSVKNKFPTIFNMQEIVHEERFVRPAVDEAARNIQAFSDMIKKTTEKALESKEKPDSEELIAMMRSTLSAPIQGGLMRYINAFFLRESLTD